MSNQNHEFKIQFEGVNLSKEASQRIQNKIKNIVLDELGHADLHQNGSTYIGIYIPRNWIGYIASQLRVDENKLGDFINKPEAYFDALTKTAPHAQ